MSKYPVGRLHGGLVQQDRDKSSHRFKNGDDWILVATDVASRGLDIKDIAMVINYDFPLQMEDYIHRIGRTGRAGKNGLSYSFFTPECFYLSSDLITVLMDSKQSVPPQLYEYEKQLQNTKDFKAFRRWGNLKSESIPSVKLHEKAPETVVVKPSSSIVVKDLQKKEFMKPCTFDNFIIGVKK